MGYARCYSLCKLGTGYTNHSIAVKLTLHAGCPVLLVQSYKISLNYVAVVVVIELSEDDLQWSARNFAVGLDLERTACGLA